MTKKPHDELVKVVLDVDVMSSNDTSSLSPPKYFLIPRGMADNIRSRSEFEHVGQLSKTYRPKHTKTPASLSQRGIII